MKVRFSRRALRDLEEIADYITADSPSAGVRARGAIVRIVDLVSKHPYIDIENARDPNSGAYS
jgi:plasmid stabilization system protein ParE